MTTYWRAHEVETIVEDLVPRHHDGLGRCEPEGLDRGSVTAPGLFPEPERVEIPDDLTSWSATQLRAGLASSLRCKDWEAVHRVVTALVRTPLAGEGLLRELVVLAFGLHEPARLYRDCGHQHEEDEDGRVPDGVFWLGGLEEYVCESGYDATVCQACDVDEDSARSGGGEWPCPTFKPLAEKLIEALGVQP